MSTGAVVAAAVVPLCILSLLLGICVFFSLREVRKMLRLVYPSAGFEKVKKENTEDWSREGSRIKLRNERFHSERPRSVERDAYDGQHDEREVEKELVYRRQAVHADVRQAKGQGTRPCR
ncbi:uncharacterized protein LTR77_001532 [Saxophila tyrrhenica]|uniref:Uncharacterized protein n=1 Tax=Saxophila tyrrhenica TaxID=1690608 RepID=A0AAV9PMD0_9PEZI|nr:hypothetical protein LTR77_001532 [Saxophila tyrrhenica]